jgi:hypothetical protein
MWTVVDEAEKGVTTGTLGGSHERDKEKEIGK